MKWPIKQGAKGPAVEDIQQRLMLLGYLSNVYEVDGEFGNLTKKAVSDFRAAEGLPEGSVVDKATWAALVDASFRMGDRTLYLRMPYYHGQDVKELQTALGVLGFSCGSVDGIFGAHTESAVREFQTNIGLKSDGIVGESTFEALRRLSHVWRDKDMLSTDKAHSSFSRAAQVLEDHEICVFGTDVQSRSIASRISNLALATNPSSKVVSAENFASLPNNSTLLVHITFDKKTPAAPCPSVHYEDSVSFQRKLGLCIEAALADRRRLVIQMPAQALVDNQLLDRDAQHLAISLLDALCGALA